MSIDEGGLFTWYPGRVHTASTTARAARCCRKGILWPSLEPRATFTCRVNMAQPGGLSQAFPPRPGATHTPTVEPPIRSPDPSPRQLILTTSYCLLTFTLTDSLLLFILSFAQCNSFIVSLTNESKK